MQHISDLNSSLLLSIFKLFSSSSYMQVSFIKNFLNSSLLNINYIKNINEFTERHQSILSNNL